MEMHAKKKRTAESDLATLFRKRERMPTPTSLAEFKLFDCLYRQISTPSGALIYLSDKANTSFLRLLDTIEAVLPSRHLVSTEDIYEACNSELGLLCDQESPSNDIDSFLVAIEAKIKKEISTHRFYTTLDGLTLKGVDQVEIGRLTLRRPSREIIEKSVAYSEMVEGTWGRMQQGLWVTVEVTGSRRYAERCFFDDVRAACGLLAVSLAIILDKGGRAIRLTPGMSGRVRPSLATWFSIDVDSNELCTSASMAGFLPITLDGELVERLLESDWFGVLTRIIQEYRDSDAEQAVRRAIYWFFDAQTDTSAEMQLVKFWSCIECFLSFENSGGITTKIKRGLTALLTFGVYEFSSLDSYSDLEKEIGVLYDLRSGAVHDAKHNHVSDRDVTTVSKWAAWIILEVAALISDGYESRSQIKEQTDRLSAICDKRRGASVAELTQSTLPTLR